MIAREVMLPRLAVGDRVLFHAAGGYTGVMASRFNGFDPPKFVWGEEGADA